MNHGFMNVFVMRSVCSLRSLCTVFPFLLFFLMRLALLLLLLRLPLLFSPLITYSAVVISIFDSSRVRLFLAIFVLVEQ